jgi:hypothetical protein
MTGKNIIRQIPILFSVPKAEARRKSVKLKCKKQHPGLHFQYIRVNDGEEYNSDIDSNARGIGIFDKNFI